jgi:hypothetical protein
MGACGRPDQALDLSRKLDTIGRIRLIGPYANQGFQRVLRRGKIFGIGQFGQLLHPVTKGSS